MYGIKRYAALLFIFIISLKVIKVNIIIVSVTIKAVLIILNLKNIVVHIRLKIIWTIKKGIGLQIPTQSLSVTNNMKDTLISVYNNGQTILNT